MQIGPNVAFRDARGETILGVVLSTRRGADVCGIYALSPLYDASVSNLNTQGTLTQVVFRSTDGRIMTASWVLYLMICLTRSFL